MMHQARYDDNLQSVVARNNTGCLLWTSFQTYTPYVELVMVPWWSSSVLGRPSRWLGASDCHPTDASRWDL